MINLLPTSAGEDPKLVKIKNRVVLITTLVLVAFILLLSAMAGGSWYLSNREGTVSQEIVQLNSQLNQLANVEAAMRQQENRIGLIQKALSERISVANAAQGLLGAEVIRWEYSPSGQQKVSALGPTASELETYAQNLKDRYTTADIDSLAMQFDGQWQIDLLLGGVKK